VDLSLGTNATGVRVFAFDAAPATGAATALIAVNFNIVGGATFLIDLLGEGVAGAARVEWHLAGEPGVSHAPVTCNGLPLAFSIGAPPDWRTLGISAAAGAPLVLAPASVAFALVQ